MNPNDTENRGESPRKRIFKFYDAKRGKWVMKIIWRVMLALTVIIVWGALLSYLLPGNNGGDYGYDSGLATDTAAVDNCNVVGLELHGILVAYIPPGSGDATNTSAYDMTASENLVATIHQADDDPAIKAILLEVDSYGGSPVAGEEVASALVNAKKPTVAYIRDAGVSAAYWAASAADYIISSDSADVGSIGVTASYLDNVAKNRKEGLNYNQLSTGEYKDMYDPDKPLTADERALAMRDLNIIQDNFIQAVATNRNLSVDKVTALADGSSLPGTLALKNGLVDELGNYEAVDKYLADQIGEEAEICW